MNIVYKVFNPTAQQIGDTPKVITGVSYLMLDTDLSETIGFQSAERFQDFLNAPDSPDFIANPTMQDLVNFLDAALSVPNELVDTDGQMYASRKEYLAKVCIPEAITKAKIESGELIDPNIVEGDAALDVPYAVESPEE